MRITTGWVMNEKGKAVQKYKTLGYFEKRKDAMLALAQYNSNPYDLTNRNITFEEVYNIWSPKHLEEYPSTRKGLAAAFNRTEPLHKMKMTDIKTVHMQSVIDTVSHMSKETQTKLKTIFRKNFSYCLENDIVQKDYSEFVTIKRNKSKVEDKFFTKDQLKLLMDNIGFTVKFPNSERKKVEQDFTPSVLILLYTGMRVGELLDTTIDDVDLENRSIHVRGTKTDNADRVVPIHDDLFPVIEKTVSENKKYLVEDSTHCQIDYAKYKRRFFDKFMAHLGLNHNPHALRHTFVSLMDSVGISSSSVTLKRIVGHSNSSVTEHYTHKEIEELREAINRLFL